jgi:hypothetical protein
MRIVIGVLVALAVIAGAGGIASYTYHAGLAQGLAQSGHALPGPGAPGGPYPAYPYGYAWHGPFGFGPFGFFGSPFFGLLWPLFWIALLFLLIRGAGRGWRRRGFAAGGPQGGGVPSWFDEWHRRAHRSGGQTRTA